MELLAPKENIYVVFEGHIYWFYCTDTIYTEWVKNFQMLSIIRGFTLKKKLIVTKLHPPMVAGIISHKVTVSTQGTFTEQSNNTSMTDEYKHQIWALIH